MSKVPPAVMEKVKKFKKIEAEFRKYGFSLVVVYQTGDDIGSVACQSSIPPEEICPNLLDVILRVADSSPEEEVGGDLLLDGDARLNDLVLWARKELVEPGIPLVVCGVSEESCAMAASGKVVEVVYSAARMMSLIAQEFTPGGD